MENLSFTVLYPLLKKMKENSNNTNQTMRILWASIILVVVSSMVTLGCWTRKQSPKRVVRTVPGGPLGIPIFGVLPFLTHYPELTLDKWARKFGSLYSLWLGNQLFVVVSDPMVAKDIFITNGAVSSSRKDLFIKSQTVFAGRGITATPYNDVWRKHRRIASAWLHPKAVDKYTYVLDREATDMVHCLLAAGEDGSLAVNPQPFAGRCSLNNMLTIVFGIRTDSINDPLVSRSLRIGREFMNTTGPMSNFVDYIPVLQHLPSRMRTRARKLHRELVETYGGMIESISQRMGSGEAVPDCLVKNLLTVRHDEQLDDLDITMIASAFMIGGVETTASIMQWFSALIPSYPVIQRRAHDELDRVVGRSRLPDLGDEMNMPYCRSIVKEVERCHNPFWLGTPHVTSEDLTYGEYFIPKDTVLVLNTWTMHHDESRHSAPDVFNPDRYMHDNTTSSQSANLADASQRDHWMFGVGRRICPAVVVAEREIWLALARMLWAFTMEKVPGQHIDLKEYDGLSGRSPVPFQIYMKPRHENVGRVLAAAARV